MSSGKHGFALLEVLAAIVILGFAAVPVAAWLSEAARALSRAREREEALADEERLLAAHTLLRAGELDLRLGERVIGPYTVTVQRPEAALYRIAVSSLGTRFEDLVTVVRRPNPRDTL